MKIKDMKSLKWVFGCLCTASLFACTPANSGYAPAESNQAQSVNINDRLSSAEWATYKADQQYINSLVKPDTRVRLNYADPTQYRFVMARMKLAGKNEKNSPYLFELLEARRKEQAARGLAVGKLAEVIQEGDSATRGERHEITAADPGKPPRLNIAAATPGVGAATSTFPNGTYYTFVDVSYGTASGTPLAPYAYHEEFEQEDEGQLVGADVPVQTIADTSASPERQWTVTSYKMEDSESAGFQDSYKIANFDVPNAAPVPQVLEMERTVIAEPVDHNNDGRIHLCFNRGSDADCDTRVIPPNPGEYWRVRVPMKGELVIRSRHKFSAAIINDTKNKLAQGLYSEWAGYISLILTQHGGGCSPQTTDVARLAYMKVFWKTVQLSAGDRMLTWNLSGDDEGLFDNTCAIHDPAKLTARIPLPVIDPEDPEVEVSKTYLTMSTELRDLPPDQNGKIAPIFVTNSCVAAGTMVRVGGEKEVAIETLKIGEEVYSPYDRADQQLDITDISKGVEPIPMVRVRDEAGRTLLLTEMHPLATPDRGMVQARALRVGDEVMTADGPSKLTEVSREQYDGKVYNLKVGSQSEKASLTKDQTIFYANGFVIGDAQIQRDLETMISRQEATTTAAQIPPQWRRDYQLSQQRQR